MAGTSSRALPSCPCWGRDKGRSMPLGSQMSIFEPDNTSLPRSAVSLSGDKPDYSYLTMRGHAQENAPLILLGTPLHGYGHGNMEDMVGSLEQVRINALEHLNSAPSVGMHDVPRESHLGFGKESDSQDKLDVQLAQHTRFVYKLQESDTTASFGNGG
ncbi:hypothetical protein ARMGADRAFT_1090689 [Armillaria gallica]|uniref:Uncharacterized protein n=1 Tax=Armillaria gallica TaxID=47427 RepID=A0A2H3D3R2_ARMGA|nr:hypothetical protein ARMGADRAFT_1090689 [Armillaria gallica]